MKKKLFALNLALFMIILSAIPAFAMQNNKEDDVFVEHQSYDAQCDMIALKEQIKNEQLQTSQEHSEGNESFALYTSRSTGYGIVVDGNSFSSLYDAKGNGWEYHANSNMLFINGYSGSGISASGDLFIYASGVNEISGSTGTYYGSDGITSSGDVNVIIASGTTYVSGGNGYSQGGDGISSNSNTDVYTFKGSSLIVTGGKTGDTSKLGGDAIFGETVYLSGNGFVRATGGNGASLYSYGCGGGCGIIGNYVYIMGSCELIGGNGYYGGPGIYFGSYCKTGVVDASISGGNGSYGYAIQNSDGLSWYYNEHTIVSGDSYSIKISIRQYTLNLLGCGGTRGTATFESLVSYYPTSYDLSEYIFRRTGYTQVGWSNASGDLVPLGDMYTPDSDTYLYAEWSPNTYKVVYNSNGGSGSMSNSIHTYDIAKNLTNCAFSKAGYAFAGWATSSNGSVKYSNRASVKNLTSINGGTVTLYAVWKKTTPYTQIKKNATNSYSVEIFNVDSGCTVIFATYQKDKLVEFYHKIYTGNKVPFTTTKGFDEIKVMVWNNLNNLKPICEANATIIE